MTDKLERSVDDKGFYGHPRGLSVLFGAEAWERFSFYGMRALLTLYMVTQLDYDEASKAYPIYGAYGALVYAFPVLGGWIANRWIGYRNAIMLGGVLMAFGHFAMAIEHELAFFTALALLCVGNGFFKPNISSTVGRLYAPEDSRRERGFTIFYMGINVGALGGSIISGWLGEGVSWHLGFGAAGVGMLVGIAWFWQGQRHIGAHGDPDDPELMRRPVIAGLNRLQLVWIASFLGVPAVAYSLYEFWIASWIINIVSVGVVAILIGMAVALGGKARLKIIALMILMFFHMMFWAGFEQAGSSFNVLAMEHVDRDFLWWTLPASVLQSINPAFIMLLVPVFNWMWRRLDDVKRNPSTPKKFSLGLIQLAAGFYVLTFGISSAIEGAGPDGVATVGLFWLTLCYFLHTTGELCLSPIGLSAVTVLAPKKWVGFCMGAWFLTIANAHLLAARIASLTGSDETQAAPLTEAAKLQNYSDVFETVALTVFIAGAVIALLSPFIEWLMRDEPPPELPKAQTVE